MSTADVRRIRRLVAADGAATLAGAGGCLGGYLGWRHEPRLLALAAIVGVHGLAVVWAWRQVDRGRPAPAVTMVCCGAWPTLVGITVLAPAAAPATAMAAIVPVVFALPYLPWSRLTGLVQLAIGCVALIGLAARVRVISPATPPAPVALGGVLVVVTLPALAGLVLLIVGHDARANRVAADLVAGRLTALRQAHRELAGHARQLAASRARLVEAADTERRRVERDLHDGAQQRLVALAVELRAARLAITEDPELASGLLTGLGERLKEAIAELRRLAHGIYPLELTSNGLPGALSTAAARAGVQASTRLTDLVRYPADIEAAIYFCCLEALTNAAKHAGPNATVSVHGADDGATLSLTIADTGAGFDAERVVRGAGLTNMADRLAVHEGTLTITSGPGEGTRVTASIPVPDRHRRPRTGVGSDSTR